MQIYILKQKVTKKNSQIFIFGIGMHVWVYMLQCALPHFEIYMEHLIRDVIWSNEQVQ